MSKKSIIAILISLIIIIVAVVMFNPSKSTTNTTERASNTSEQKDQKFDTIPEVALTDYDGNEVQLSSFAGKPLIVNSWAVWCPFCRDELSDFAALQEEFDDDIVVIAIDRAESREKAKGFTDEIGITGKMTFLLDKGDNFYRKIGGFSMPETVFVDADGNIRVHKRGPMRLEEMKEKTKELLEVGL